MPGLQLSFVDIGKFVGVFEALDKALAKGFTTAKKAIRGLKLARFGLLVLSLLLLGLMVAIFLYPEISPYVQMGFIFLLGIIPFMAIRAGLGKPLKAKSLMRIIDQGHKRTSKELAIRLAVRKLHEESIATEELLVDTALNEGRKAINKYRRRAELVRKRIEEMEQELHESDDESPKETS